MRLKAKYVKLIIGYFAALLCVLLLTPQTYLLAPYKLSPKDVLVLPSAYHTLPYRLASVPSDVSMNEQFRPRQSQPRHFHFGFDEDWPVEGPRTIFIPSTSSETRIHINGAPLGNDTEENMFAPGLGKGWTTIDVPRWALLPGPNRLDVYEHADAARAGVRAIYFGPTDKVQRVARQYKAWTRAGPILTSLGGAAIIVLALLGVFYNASRVTYFIAGSLGSLVLGQASLSLFTDNTALNSIDLLLRFTVPVLILAALYVLWRADRKIWTTKLWGLPAEYRGPLYALAITGPLAALAVLTLPFHIPAPIFFAALALMSPLPLLFARTVPMLIKDVSARNSKLGKLQEKLGEQEQALNQEIKNRAVLEERQRFTRDIHDGIGGQLLSLLLRVRTGNLETEEIAEEIQGGLNDLRLVVDSMDHTGDDLIAALTTFHARANTQLATAGIDLSWTQPSDINVEFRSTRAILHIYRFLQESLTNIVRHADAKNVAITLSQDKPDAPLIIEILDDGKGMPKNDAKGAGKGLANLKLRAQRLGGTLVFTTGIGGDGTGIVLTIPLLAQLD